MKQVCPFRTLLTLSLIYGNGTEWSPIRSVIVLVITDRFGQHKVLNCQLIKTITKSEKKVTTKLKCFGK